jgi:hypothetical protein
MKEKIHSMRSTNPEYVILMFIALACALTAAQTVAPPITGTVLNPQRHPVTTSDKAYPPQLSGKRDR